MFVFRPFVQTGHELVLHDAGLFPFNGNLDDGSETSESPEFRDRMTRKKPEYPGTCYDGPLDPDKIADLELPDGQAEGKGQRYLLCAPYLPGFLVKNKQCGKHSTTFRGSEAIDIIGS